ncbi:MAG: hypothetical protein ABJD11_11630 [Gemmatimonadota bacterium]
MTGSRILIQPDQRTAGGLAPAPESAWYMLGGLGLVLAIVAFADLCLAWYPARMGQAEWEFGTVTATFANLPLLATSLVLVLGSSVARGKRKTARGLSLLFALLAVLIIGLGVMYAGVIPAALASSKDPQVLLGLRRAITKTVSQAVLYSIGFLWLAFKAWRHTSG